MDSAKKNQRKQRSRKRKDSQQLSSSVESETAVYIAQISNSADQLSLSDSGIEIEDSDPAEGSNPSQIGDPSNSNKKNRKKNKGKNRRRVVSESNDLMFDIDL